MDALRNMNVDDIAAAVTLTWFLMGGGGGGYAADRSASSVGRRRKTRKSAPVRRERKLAHGEGVEDLIWHCTKVGDGLTFGSGRGRLEGSI